MARATKKLEKPTGDGANSDLEQKLSPAADALRNNRDAAGYKHVVLGVLVIKHISDAFEPRYAELDAQRAQGADPGDRDESHVATIFWVPKGSALAAPKGQRPEARQRLDIVQPVGRGPSTPRPS